MAIKIGTQDLKELYIGNTPIKQVYIGMDKVWDELLIYANGTWFNNIPHYLGTIQGIRSGGYGTYNSIVYTKSNYYIDQSNNQLKFLLIMTRIVWVAV